MAKQLINVGASPNDGTGDSLRSAGQKLNSMLNEVYEKLGDGTNIKIDIETSSTVGQVLRSNGVAFINAALNYNDLINRPVIPAAQVNSDWNATSGISQILNRPTLSAVATSGSYSDLTGRPALFSGNYNDLTNKPTIPAAQVNTDWNASSGVARILNKPSLSVVATSGLYDDLGNKPTLSAVATSGSYNDLLSKPTLFSGSYNDLTNKPNVPVNIQDLSNVEVTAPTTGQVLKYDGTTWVNSIDDISGGGGGSSLQQRGTLTVSTGTIANNASSDVAVIGFKTYALLKITTSAAAWVTIYTSTVSRTADAGRSETTDPIPGSGVVAEVITTAAATQAMTPVAIGFNDDQTPSENIYLKIVNKSGSAASISVTLTVLQLEA
jgi:hypothetical protein